LQTPAFVDRMDLPDDADGRVAIFALDEPGDVAAEVMSPSVARGGPVHTALDRVGSALDGPYTGVVIAAALAVILVLGLLFLRR
jgi:hypothetical protein